MSLRTALVGSAFVEVVTVLDFDGVTPVSGLTEDDFEVWFYREGEEDDSLSATVSEIGDRGDYCVAVADGFSSTGIWSLVVKFLYNEAIWRTQVEVSAHSIDEVFDIVVAGGSGNESVVLTLVDSAHGGIPVADVLVNVLNAEGTTFITFGRTNSSGVVTLMLDTGVYSVRTFKPGLGASTTEIVVEAGGLEQTIEVESVTVEPPANPSVCRLYADFLEQDGEPHAGVRLRVTNLFKPSTAQGIQVTEKISTYTSDVNGHVQFDAVQGTRVRVSIVGSKMSREIIVPSLPVANLLTIFGAAPDAFAVVRSA